MADPFWQTVFHDVESGGPQEQQRLFAALYQELHQLAERQLRRSSGMSISATTLLHEAYLDLAATDAEFPDKGRFMSYAARVMRGLIIDFTRRRCAIKRGSEFHITRLDTGLADSVPATPPADPDLERLSEAIEELTVQDAGLAELVDLKYFCGLSFGEIAALRNSSERTVQRDWEKARMLLFARIEARID